MKESTMNGGRVAVHVPDHPRANNRGYILRSRYVMEQHLGRILDSDEEVHHKDENPTNDVIENLEIKSKAEHARLHILKGRKGFGERTLDYEAIRELVKQGLGYKRVASTLGISIYSAKYAVKVLRAELGGE